MRLFCKREPNVLFYNASGFVISAYSLILKYNVIRIYQVLLTSAFILWPPCTCGFGIREKIRCGLRFFGVFLCGFVVFRPPLRPPPYWNIHSARKLGEILWRQPLTSCPSGHAPSSLGSNTTGKSSSNSPKCT